MYSGAKNLFTGLTTKSIGNTSNKSNFGYKNNAGNVDSSSNKDSLRNTSNTGIVNETNNTAKDITRINVNMQTKESDGIELDLSKKSLKEAIIWSEILGEPKCKQRKRR